MRVAILAVLAEEPLNGYQVIQQIADRTDGAWRPSPGSVYPTISQLEDEGLIEGDDERGRRTLRLSDAGRDYLAAHEDEVADVWAPFEGGQRAARETRPGSADFTSLKPELGRVMNAVWQIITTGTDEQRRAAIGVLVEARRGLYGILADHPGDDGEVDDLGDHDPDDDEEESVNDRVRIGDAERERRGPRAGRALRDGPDHRRGARRAAGADLGGADRGRPRAGLRRPAASRASPRPRRPASSGRRSWPGAPRVPFLVQAAGRPAGRVLRGVAHLPWLLVALLVYLSSYAASRHRGRVARPPRALALSPAASVRRRLARLTQTSPTSMPTFW